MTTTSAPGIPAGETRPPNDLLTEERSLSRRWSDPPGLLGRLAAVQNGAIGPRIMFTAFSFFLLGGINALVMRLQLAYGGNTLIGPDTYNELFTMHGSTMMFLFAVPILEGFAILLLPSLLGNREMPFPRLGAFSFWLLLFGGILFYLSFLFNAVPDAGWFAYTPLSGPQFSPGIALDFWLLALGVAEVGAIAAGIEIIIAILNMRAPGMTVGRMPVFAWAWLVTAFAILAAFTPLFVATMLLELDRKIGTSFFNPSTGGSAVLWQHLFWIFGHPEVYIQFLPAAGFVSMITPVFARRPLAGYPLVVVSLVATGFISFGLWVHHMFTVGLPQVSMTLFAAASMILAIPSGIQVFAWLTTIGFGRPKFKSPILFVIGFLAIFVLGGITGIMVGAVPFDWQVHDSFFVVAHFHYVLIGGVTFPIFGAIYYWAPKFTGRLLSEAMGKLHFWLFFIGFNVTFFPMHIAGFLGMPRRVYTYVEGQGLEVSNLISTVGAFLIAASVVVFLVNFFWSLRRGERAGANPWDADSLEWSTPSPGPPHGFTLLPIVHSRHPLWDLDITRTGEEDPRHLREDLRRVQEQLHQGDERVMRLTEALSRWPLTWRAALVTTTLDAVPAEIFRVAGPSVFPFFTAVGLIAVFAAEIWSLHWVAAAGVVIMVASLVGWHWPDEWPMTEEEEEAFEQEYGIQVRGAGSPTVARYAMWLVIFVLAVVLATFLFSYVFLRLQAETWPPGDLSVPPLPLAVVAAVALAIGTGLMMWARNRIENEEVGSMRLGLLLGSLFAVIALGVQGYAFSQLGFDWSETSFGSLFWVMGGFAMLLLLGALGVAVLAQIWSVQQRFTRRRHLVMSNTFRLWAATLIMWLITFGVLYLVPRLT